MPNPNPLAAYFPAAQGLTRAVPGSQLMSPDDYTQLPLEPMSHSAPVDPYVANAVMQDRLKSEFEDRLFNAQRTGDTGDVSALQTALGRISQDQASGPLAQQRRQLDAWNTAQQNAMAQGFRGGVPTQDPRTGVWSTASADPSALMAGAQREAEAAKSQIPLQQTLAVQQAETGRATQQQAATAAEKEAERAAERNRFAQLQAALAANPELAKRLTDINTKGELKFATPAQSTVLPKVSGQQQQILTNKIHEYFQLLNPTDLSYRFGLYGDAASRQQKAMDLKRELDQYLAPGWDKRSEQELTSQMTAPTGIPNTSVRMRAPNGQETMVSADQVEHYKTLGATIVQ